MSSAQAAGLWKLLYKPVKGQCDDWQPPYGPNSTGPFLFELRRDPTESDDLCSVLPERCAAMRGLLARFDASVVRSRVWESRCGV